LQTRSHSVGSGHAEPNAIENAIDYAKHRSPGVYDDAGNAIETHEHMGDFNAREKTVVVYFLGRYKIVKSTLRSSRRGSLGSRSW
jgi:hypothetical protein